MKLPKNMTEEEVLETIEKIASKLCYKFKFGYHCVEDMKQQATLFALEGLDSYDEKRPLENFLWTHVRNRLFNYKRDNFERPDKPCFSCPFYDPSRSKSNNECTEFSDKSECTSFSSWFNRNSRKKNLMSPVKMSDMTSGSESFLSKSKSELSNIIDEEVIKVIDKNISLDIRLDYIRFKNGLKLPKPRRDAVKKEIAEIIKEHKLDG